MKWGVHFPWVVLAYVGNFMHGSSVHRCILPINHIHVEVLLVPIQLGAYTTFDVSC